MKKSFAVIGLGKFGASVARSLAQANQEVMVVDISEERIKEIADEVTYALQADVTEAGVLESLGLGNMDMVVVSISEKMEASILATIFAKEAGVPHVVAKAMNEIHGTILKRVGADEVVFPEQSMGIRVANNLMSGGFSDMFELSPAFSMVEFPIPEKWAGKSLVDLELRGKLGLNVVAIRDGKEVEVDVDPRKTLKADTSLIVVGKNRKLWEILQERGDI